MCQQSGFCDIGLTMGRGKITIMMTYDLRGVNQILKLMPKLLLMLSITWAQLHLKLLKPAAAGSLRPDVAS